MFPDLKMKVLFPNPKPPAYVWIIYTNPDWFTRSRPDFWVHVSKDNTWIISTQAAAYEILASMADDLAEKTQIGTATG